MTEKNPNIKLSKFLARHDSVRRNRRVLSQVVGDAELYHTNLIYRNVRDGALALGFKFSETFDYPYVVQPLMCLNDIIQTKTIPVLDNVSCLRDLEKDRPGVFRMDEIMGVAPRANYLMHESIHCIVHEWIRKNESSKVERVPEKLALLKIMIGEAFANVAELIARQLTSDLWLAKQTLYAERVLPIFEKFQAKYGLEAFMKLALAFYLYSNYLCDGLSQNEIDLAIEFAEIPDRYRKDKFFVKAVQDLVTAALELSPDFRVITTSFFLKIAGFKKDISILCDYDPIAYLLKQERLLATTRELCVKLCAPAPHWT